MISNEHKDLTAKEKAVLANIRLKFNDLEQFIEENVVSGRRRSIAMSNLETASMFAIKAATVGDN